MIKEEFSNSLNCNYYENNAFAQKFTANFLFNKINQIQFQNVLEIGFGTGFLTKKLTTISINKLDAIETSEKMFNFAKKNFFHKNLNYSLKEKNWILNEKLNTTYDLIISNFTFQWFDNLEENLNILSKYAKKIIFSIPLQESFLNINFNLIENLMLENDLKNKFKNYEIINFSEEYINEIFFAKHLKLIGATKKINRKKNVYLFSKDKIKINYKIAVVILDN